MHDRQAQPTARAQDPSRLTHGLGQAVDVVQRHIGQDKIKALVPERERSSISRDEWLTKLVAGREAYQWPRRIQAYYGAVPAGSQNPAHPALTTAEIQYWPAGPRQQAQHRRKVHLLVPGIASRTARQPGPSFGL